MFEHIWRDLRWAYRGLWRAKAFAAMAILTLSVGMAGTTTMFALVEGVLLRPLPVHDQRQLLIAWKEVSGAGHWPFDIKHLDVMRNEARSLETVAGVGYNGALPVAVSDNGAASYVRTATVTGDFFDVLGVEPILGRSLTRADNVDGAERVLVISHGLWQRSYGGSSDVLGRRVTIQRQPFTIVGVMPRDLEYPRSVEAWTPIAAAMSVRTNTAFHVAVDIVGRLRSGVTIAQATSELNTIAAQLQIDSTSPTTGQQVVGRPFADVVIGDMRMAMLVLFAAVGLVLLIACANVANLLLLRAEARRSELALRVAIGAGRLGLVRQILAESLVLALAAGSIALAMTWWTLQAIVSLVPGGLVRAESIRLDAAVVIFGIAVAFLTSALAGIIPALVASGADLVTHLRSGGRGHSGAGMRRSRRGLVVAQVALAVTTVAAAGLLARSVLNLETLGISLAADRLVLVPLELPQPKYAERARHLQFLKDVMARLEATTGIRAATPVNATPLAGIGWDALFTAEGQTDQAATANPLLNLESIHPNYFSTFDVPIVLGRAFTSDDRDGRPDVAIVSEDVANRIWPGQSPLGKRLKIGKLEDKGPWRTVVGVARPTRYRELSEPKATLYLPAEQFLVAAQTLVVRSSSPLPLVGRLVRERVLAIDADVQVMRAVPFAELLQRPLARPRFNALLTGAFGVAALLLSCVGLYAVIAAFVGQRTREIGIRVALGATGADVRRLVVSEGALLGGIGAALGLATALAAAPMLRDLLYDVHPLDPATMLSAALLLVAMSALAAYIPVRRATRIDPVYALRAE
jgi:putative ABC transport system permease protein